MTDVFLVFVTPNEAIGEDEFNAFQDRHNFEVLDTPGFIAVRRYALLNSRGEGFPVPFRYMTIYEVTLPPEQLSQELARTAPNRERPEWYPREVTVQSLSGSSLDDHPDLTATSSAYLVFTGTPTSMSFDQYDAWNASHQKDNLGASRLLEQGFRFRLSAGSRYGRPMPDHFEMYSLAGSPKQMLAEVQAASAEFGWTKPNGFRHFASFEATAVADQRRTY